MLDSHLRHVKDNTLSPLLTHLPRSITPNQLTVLGFAIGLLVPPCSYFDRPGLALAAWLLNRLLDGLDGALARATGRQSPWGGFLDILCDFTIYSFLPMGVALSPSHRSTPTLVVLSALLASFHINNVVLFYLSSALPDPPPSPVEADRTPGSGPTRGSLTSLRMMPALVEGTESLVLFSLMLLLPGRFVLVAGSMAGLVAVNIAQRTVVAWEMFGEAEERARRN